MGDLSTPQPRSLLYLLSFGFLAAAGAIYTPLRISISSSPEKKKPCISAWTFRVCALWCILPHPFSTGLAVSVSGAIATLASSVPHVILRLIFGRRPPVHVLPASALAGAIAIVIADTRSRAPLLPLLNSLSAR